MKRIKTYQIFESEKKELTPEQEEFLNRFTKGQWKWNPSTGEVDVEGDFDCRWMRLKDLKGIRFGRVSGNFICADNDLKSLVGGPQVVGGDFYCRNNDLESLEGGPQQVGGNFGCHNNRLESLEGAPQQVGGGFYCEKNRLKSLKGGPQTVGGHFYCSTNLLESLKGGPQTVGGHFNCFRNSLESLKGGPQVVGGYFNCENNDLKSLAGGPQEVGEYFNCENNDLKSLEGAPQQVGGSFYCDEFSLGVGQWNLTGWMKILKDGKPEAQNLIMTLLSPEVLNQEIQKDPQGMIQRLKGVWDAEGFAEVQKKLKFPPEFGDVDGTIRSLQKLDSMKDFI